MTRNNEIARAVCRALLMSAVAATAVTPTYAQDQEPDNQELATVVVTGSRIVSPNLQSVSPVAAISAKDIGVTGKVRVEDIINQLPQAFAAQGANVSNGATGTATVNLRGLESKRTLVLVNGRRLMPGDPTGSNAADLNQVPAALIQRVEVLTGGASSVYGADAVAGVVNFIMNTEFEGIRFETNYNFYSHENDNDAIADVVRQRYPVATGTTNAGHSKDFTLLLGGNFGEDRGNATFYATYREVDAVLQGEFDYSSCALNSGDTSFESCGGSSTTAPGRFNQIIGSALGPSMTLGPGGTLIPYDNPYNFGPINYYQRPDERVSTGLFMNYDVTETMNAYAELSFMNDNSIAQIAPSGAFFGNTYTVNCDNPLLSADQVNTWCGGDAGAGDIAMLIGRRNVEGGGRRDDLEHTSWRGVVGLRGDIGENWTYDAYGQFGTVELSETYFNDFSIQRIQRALLAVDDGSGNVVCRSVVDGTDPNCIPWNIYGTGEVSAEALGYLQVPGNIRADLEETVINASITGDLTAYGIKLPTADVGLNVNVGLEYRDESVGLQPDVSFATGDLAGQGAATLPLNGGFDVSEFFFEARLPLIQDMPGIANLDFETGYRFSDYSTGAETDTYKFGLMYSPVEALRFRGSFARAVRAPNLGELFAQQRVALDGSTDPCAGILGDADPDDDPTASQVACEQTGMTAAQYGTVPKNPAGQYNGLIGGNPNLNPESSDTVSFGLVFRPDLVPGLFVAIDYFDIEVEDTIAGVGADLAINECLASGDPFFCNLIHRDQFGSLWLDPNEAFIIDTDLNTGGLATKGIDLDVNYHLDIGSYGSTQIGLVGTYLDKLETQPLPTSGTYDCAGLYGNVCGTPNPEWRHALRTTWETPWHGLSLSLNWRYYDGVLNDLTSTNLLLNPDGDAPPGTDRELGSRSYLDLAAGLTVSERYHLRLGVNNLTDKEPPIVGSSSCPSGICNGNTYAQVYDALGRQIFGTVTIDF